MSSHCYAADLILFNGDFRTQDPARPRVRAVAVCGGKIIATGSDGDILKLRKKSTRVLDLQGMLGLPGLTDCHFHYYDWALGRRQLRLSDVGSLQELVRRVAEAAKRLPEGRWILGQAWNEMKWPVNRMPTRWDLDEAAPDHPVMLIRSDFHVAVVNSLALRLGGIDQNTDDPPQGVISRDESGNPNGILRDLAINLIKEKIPIPTLEEISEAMVDAMPVLHRLGVTGVHDFRLMGGLESSAASQAWQYLDQTNRLRLRCWLTLAGERLEEAVALGMRTGFGSDRLRFGHLKFFADGSMGARTAWVFDPYLDADRGLPLTPIDELEKRIRIADCHGLAVAVHAIGDRANHELIRILVKLKAEITGQDHDECTSRPCVPHRIEHVQMIRPDDLDRLAHVGVVASVQPLHVLDDMRMIDRCVGGRGRWAYPFRSMIDAGVPVIFGSDCPVADPNPLEGIYAAVSRCRKDGYPPGGWYPEQRSSIEQATSSYTVAPARACGRERDLGSITPGKWADIAVFDRNIYTIDPGEILQTHAVLTLFNGEIVHQLL